MGELRESAQHARDRPKPRTYWLVDIRLDCRMVASQRERTQDVRETGVRAKNVGTDQRDDRCGVRTLYRLVEMELVSVCQLPERALLKRGQQVAHLPNRAASSCELRGAMARNRQEEGKVLAGGSEVCSGGFDDTCAAGGVTQ